MTYFLRGNRMSAGAERTLAEGAIIDDFDNESMQSGSSLASFPYITDEEINRMPERMQEYVRRDQILDNEDQASVSVRSTTSSQEGIKMKQRKAQAALKLLETEEEAQKNALAVVNRGKELAAKGRSAYPRMTEQLAAIPEDGDSGGSASGPRRMMPNPYIRDYRSRSRRSGGYREVRKEPVETRDVGTQTAKRIKRSEKERLRAEKEKRKAERAAKRAAEAEKQQAGDGADGKKADGAAPAEKKETGDEKKAKEDGQKKADGTSENKLASDDDKKQAEASGKQENGDTRIGGEENGENSVEINAQTEPKETTESDEKVQNETGDTVERKQAEEGGKENEEIKTQKETPGSEVLDGKVFEDINPPSAGNDSKVSAHQQEGTKEEEAESEEDNIVLEMQDLALGVADTQTQPKPDSEISGSKNPMRSTNMQQSSPTTTAEVPPAHSEDPAETHKRPDVPHSATGSSEVPLVEREGPVESSGKAPAISQAAKKDTPPEGHPVDSEAPSETGEQPEIL